MKKKITAVLLGAGARGGVYARYALDHPDEFQIVAIAEPDTAKREAMKKAHKIPEDSVYETWEPLLEQPRFADAALICTMDQMHTGPAVKALELGYHVLLEKPMAVREEDCRRIGAAAEKNKRLLSICHVLRYTPFYSEIKRIIDSGRLGKILAVQQIEHVGYWHQAQFCPRQLGRRYHLQSHDSSEKLSRHGHSFLADRRYLYKGLLFRIPYTFQTGKCTGWRALPLPRRLSVLRFLPLLRSPLLSGASKGSFRRFRVNGYNGTGKGKTDGSPAPWTLRPLCLSLR